MPIDARIIKFVRVYFFSWTAIKAENLEANAGRLQQEVCESNDAVMLDLRAIWLNSRPTVLDHAFTVGQERLKLRRVQL